MIFLFHLLSLITASLGLILSYYLNRKKRIKTHVMLFFLFLGLGLFIHLFFDSAVSKESFIKYYLNLEPWPDNLTLDYLFNDITSTRQHSIP